MSKLSFRELAEAEIGTLTMSGSELRRIEVLSEVLARKRTELSAAAILGLSTRQTQRLVQAYRGDGGGALINKARGRASNNQLIIGVRKYVVELMSTCYADFGPTLAAEVLLEKDGVKVSRETLYTSGRLRTVFGCLAGNEGASICRDLRRESYGELVSDRRQRSSLVRAARSRLFTAGLHRRATGQLMQLRFVPSESTNSYFEALNGYLTTHD